ncbi:MAG: agmatinase [Rhodothermales bacterium]|nr:agmatinase [Rhodothermales bacterium]MBO6780878.1 agmatinase [Rhodothermales bacterium]
MIRLLGIPFDAASSFMQGAAQGPAAIREAMRSPSANTWTEGGLDLAAAAWDDAGDVVFPQTEAATEGPGWAAGSLGEPHRDAITERVAREVEAGNRLLTLGGDHSITYPIMRAYASAWPGLTILHLDAHADLYDEFEGDRFSHACPFARIMEGGLAARLVQVGVRTMTGHQADQRDRFGVETQELKDGQPAWPAVEGPVYVSLDLDVLDPAFAPGVSHHEPGGLSTRQVLDLLHAVPGTLVGADLVELNPRRDVGGISAMAAARLAKELLGRLLADA